MHPPNLGILKIIWSPEITFTPPPHLPNIFKQEPPLIFSNKKKMVVTNQMHPSKDKNIWCKPVTKMHIEAYLS